MDHDRAPSPGPFSRCRVAVDAVGCRSSVCRPAANDARGGAQALGRLPASVRGTTVDATLEASELGSGCTQTKNSVWFTFTAPSNRPVLIALDAGGDLDATIDVYERERSQVTPVDCRNTNRRGAATLDIDASGGTSYYIRVGARRELSRCSLRPAGRGPGRGRDVPGSQAAAQGRGRSGRPPGERGRRLGGAAGAGPDVPAELRLVRRPLRRRRALRQRGLVRERSGPPSALRRLHGLRSGRERHLQRAGPRATRLARADQLPRSASAARRRDDTAPGIRLGNDCASTAASAAASSTLSTCTGSRRQPEPVAAEPGHGAQLRPAPAHRFRTPDLVRAAGSRGAS